MTKRFIFKIKPKTPLHLARMGIGVENTEVFIHSDTLFSAICVKWRMLFGDLEELLKGFNINGKEEAMPFLISSAFPYCKEVLFFPRPMVSGQNGQVRGLTRVKFVSYRIFQKIINGDNKKFCEDNLLIQGNSILVDKEDLSVIEKVKNGVVWSTSRKPRNTLDRITSSSNIYHFGEVAFATDCGLYFFVDIQDDYRERFEAVMRLLAEEGVGGDRSSGKGVFEASELEDNTFNIPSTGKDGFITLSLYHPEFDDVKNGLLDDANFELITRTGWISSPDGKNLRRKAVRMFTEGSYFRKNEIVWGNLVEVTPDRDLLPERHKTIHNIYRYGYPYKVGVNL